jgi:hypothetical protein
MNVAFKCKMFMIIGLILHFIFISATTHTDLILRAVEKGIPYKVVHNASIMNAIGCCGLQVSRLISQCRSYSINMYSTPSIIDDANLPLVDFCCCL